MWLSLSGKKEDKQRVGGQTLTLSSVRITALVSSTSWAQDQRPGFKSAETFVGSFWDVLGVLKTHGVCVAYLLPILDKRQYPPNIW